LERESSAHRGESASVSIDRGTLLAYKAHGDQELKAALDGVTREAKERSRGYLPSPHGFLACRSR
jgi:hypothetical protein